MINHAVFLEGLMDLIEQYFWEPNDPEEFLNIYREIYDQRLHKVGASDMSLGEIAQIRSCMLWRCRLKTLWL